MINSRIETSDSTICRKKLLEFEQKQRMREGVKKEE